MSAHLNDSIDEPIDRCEHKYIGVVEGLDDLASELNAMVDLVMVDELNAVA